MTILTWNVRGLNIPSMQLEVRQKIQTSKASLVVLLETKVKQSSYHCMKNSILPVGWLESSNLDV